MKLFTVSVVAKDLVHHELEIALRSFSHLVAKVTPKHRKSLRLNLEAQYQEQTYLLQLLHNLKLTKYVVWFTSTQLEATETSILLYPTLNTRKQSIEKNLSMGIPVLTFDNSQTEQLIDASCGILVPYRTGDRAAQVFSDYLRMLYFDSEAHRFLKKGAIRRSQRQLIQMPATALSMAS